MDVRAGWSRSKPGRKAFGVAAGLLIPLAAGAPAMAQAHNPYEGWNSADQTTADQHLPRKEAQREMRKIRAKYFGSIRNTEIRQIGIAKLREFTDPVLFADMLEIFGHEQHDVVGAVLDHFADQKSEEADAALAWAAVHNADAWVRDESSRRLSKRLTAPGAPADGTAPWRIKTIIAQGLSKGDEETIKNAATLASFLKLYEMIPHLIEAQLNGAAAGIGNGGGDTSLAYIIVGKQQAFVADLTPIVGDSAVAFDPTVGVLTEGTVLRIIDAVVITYRTEVHGALVALGNSGWNGQRTDQLGWDQKAWRDWYANEFLPYRATLAAAEKK
jgi:hypothetical protein